MKLQYWKGIDGQWYFDIQAKNNRVVIESKGYRRKRSLLKTVSQFIYLTPQFVRK